MKNNQIWYGSKNNETVFAREEQSLKNHGINSPQSFAVDGDVTGLQLIDEQQVGATQSQNQQTSGGSQQTA